MPEPLAPWYILVSTYGIPSYREANPAVLSIVTFPFLFGMMFGDIGHGSLLLLAGIFFCAASDAFRGGTLDYAVQGRYLLLLMGFFATYCGFVYNEFFAIPLNVFHSCYRLGDKDRWQPTLDEETGHVEGEWVYPRRGYDCTYAFGYDPAWGLTTNNLAYANNIKMKLSVIFGVLHMTMGILTKGSNAIHFKHWAVLLCEVFTGILILGGLFGWMDVLIFAKWFYPLDIEDRRLVNPEGLEDDFNQDVGTRHPVFQGDYDNQHMPSIINIMINTVFGFGRASDQEVRDGSYTYIGPDRETMYNVGFGLLIVVVVLIPVMLFVRPCFFRRKGVPNPRDSALIDLQRKEKEAQGGADLEEQYQAENANRLKKVNQ